MLFNEKIQSKNKLFLSIHPTMNWINPHFGPCLRSETSQERPLTSCGNGSKPTQIAVYCSTGIYFEFINIISRSIVLMSLDWYVDGISTTWTVTWSTRRSTKVMRSHRLQTAKRTAESFLADSKQLRPINLSTEFEGHSEVHKMFFKWFNLWAFSRQSSKNNAVKYVSFYQMPSKCSQWSPYEW